MMLLCWEKAIYEKEKEEKDLESITNRERSINVNVADMMWTSEAFKA